MPSCAKWSMFAALAICIVTVSATARASCSQGPLGYLIWPKADATDVPVDTPIVIGRYFVAGDTNVITTALQAADGTEIPLHEIRRLPPPYVGCGAAETLFLRPERRLNTGEMYTVVNRPGDKGAAVFTRKFTVGERVTEPAVEPSVIYLEVFDRLDCVNDGCPSASNVQVDLGAPPPQPLWLRLQGSAPDGNTNGWIFYPLGYSGLPDDQLDNLSKTVLGVSNSDADSCIDIAIVGVEGRTLFEERRCQPDRCAVGGLRFLNSGGRPGGAAVDIAQVPDGSCADPPVLSNGTTAQTADAVAASAQAGDDAGPHTKRRRQHASNGCSASRASAGQQVGWLVPLAAAAAITLAQRRKRRRHD